MWHDEGGAAGYHQGPWDQFFEKVVPPPRATGSPTINTPGDRSKENNHNLPIDGNVDSSQENPKEQTNEATDTQFDAMVASTETLLEQKLETNRAWAAKLMQEMTVYSRTLKEVHAEYMEIQEIEDQEAQRLDQVEPDVERATSHLLQHPLLGNLAPGMGSFHSSGASSEQRHSG